MKRAILFLLTLLAGSAFAGEAAEKKHPEYPRVKDADVPEILAMRSGVVETPVRLPWRLLVPSSVPAGEKLPLVVCLHGAGSRGDDSVSHVPLFRGFWSAEAQKRHPAFVLLPQMKIAWVRKPGGFTNYDSEKVPIAPEMEALLRLVGETIADHPIDPNRVYLVGMSMGGYGVWDALIREPGRWAAAAPICGGADPAKAALIKDIPLWVWHGAKDTTVPPENSRVMIDALKKAGGDPIYSEPATGHGSWVNAFAEPKLYEWMFAQKKD